MRIAIIHASAGHGHAKAALAAKEGFLACGVPEKEVLVLDALDETPAWFKNLYTSLYYYSVKHTPRAWGFSYKLFDHEFLYITVIRWGRTFVNSWVARNLVKRMEREKPEALIFTHFLAPEILGRAKKEGRISAYLAAAVTDFIPHRFWINAGTNHYWVMSEEGKAVLEKRGVSSDQITAGGIPISLHFRSQDKKREFREKEGLLADRFTLLITSGSFGLGPTPEVLEVLREFGDSIQAMVVCGRNETLYQDLKKGTYPFRVKLYGFVNHMDELMEASDLLVAKPGGATTSESLAKGVPMVVLDPIPGQEAGNALLLKERNASFFMHKPQDIRVILKGIFDYPQVLEEKKRSIQNLAKPDAALDLARFVLQKIGSK